MTCFKFNDEQRNVQQPKDYKKMGKKALEREIIKIKNKPPKFWTIAERMLIEGKLEANRGVAVGAVKRSLVAQDGNLISSAKKVKRVKITRLFLGLNKDKDSDKN